MNSKRERASKRSGEEKNSKHKDDERDDNDDDDDIHKGKKNGKSKIYFQLYGNLHF